MNKIFNYCTMLLVSVLALTLGACTEEYEYTPATISGEQVYFSNTLPARVNLLPNETQAQVPVNRAQRSGALTVPITVTMAEGTGLTVSNEVTFADGDSVAYVTISYNPDQIGYGDYKEITLSIANPDYTTPYGETSYTFSAGKSEWDESSTSTGYFREGLMSSLFSDIPQQTYQVDIQKSVVTEGRYRIVRPYGIRYDNTNYTEFYRTYVTTNIFTWVGDNLDTDIIIDATDPNYVYIENDFYPGMEFSSLGVFHFFSSVCYNLANGYSIDEIKAQAPDQFGRLENGVITFPDYSFGLNFDNTLSIEEFGMGWGYQLAVALPGYEFTDYSSSFAYNGRFTDVGENNYAQGTITLGEDVAMARYIIAGSGDDVNAIIEGLSDGSVEGTVVTASGDVSVQLEESGTYYFIIVTFNESGEAKEYSVTRFTYNIGNTEKAEWEPVCNGTYDINYIPNFITDEDNNYVGNPFGDGQYTTTLYVDANNGNHFKIDPWLFENLAFEFTVDEQGIISFDDVDTGQPYGNYGNLMVTNANTIFAESGQVFSFYAQDGYFAFGTMYYVPYQGSYGWIGGATEIFAPDGVEMPVVQEAPAKTAKMSGKLVNKKIVATTPMFENKTNSKFKSFRLKNHLKAQPFVKK